MTQSGQRLALHGFRRRGICLTSCRQLAEQLTAPVQLARLRRAAERQQEGPLNAYGCIVTTATAALGRDPLGESLAALVRARGWPMAYAELDPDVFGEELDTPAYACAERIAAVGLVVQRPAP